MEKLVLIDGNSLINRAFYAMPLLTTKSGTFTNAVYGFLNMFFKMVENDKPSYVGVAFDLKAPTFRHKMFADYKGTRKPMPEELRPQIPLLKEVLKTMGVAIFEKEGVEADDIIGTIAKKTSVFTLIYTGDKDSFQLVDDETSVCFTRRGITETELYSIDNFKEKTGIDPIQIIDLKSLMGDSSDNIPGVHGVGEKTALSLVQKYGSVEKVYENADELSGKLKEKILSGKDSAMMSKTLATINVDCGIDFSLDKMKFSLPLSAAAEKKFAELEFKGILKNKSLFSSGKTTEKKENLETLSLSNGKASDYTPDADELSFVVNRSDLNTDEKKRGFSSKPEIVKIKSEEDFVKISGLNLQDFSEKDVSFVIGKTALSVFDGKTEYDIYLANTLLDDGLNASDAVKLVFPLLNNAKRLIVFGKKDVAHYLYDNFRLSLPLNVEDVSLIKYLADFSGSQTLDDVFTEYGENPDTPALSLFNLYNELYEKLRDENMVSLYRDVELPLSNVLFSMEESGFKVDIAALKETGKKYAEILSEKEAKIREYAGDVSLNVNSPKQLGELIFEKLKLGKGKKTKTGYSTSADVLEKLEDAHPVIPLILSYRKTQKLLSTYIEGFYPLIDDKTGLIHTSFNQTVTTTGRLSSKEPNLQNIPVRDDEGKELRKFFVPKTPDRVLISADYSQIELRLLAAFSDTKSLIDAFRHEKDVHAATAAKVFNVKISEVTPLMRRNAKAVNFGIIYGISEYGLAKNLNVSAKEAKSYIDSYFKEYPEVKDYMNRNVAFAKKTGYAVTMLGRRRYIRELNSPSFSLRQFGERAAMNMPLQGSSADIIKLAMINVYNRLKRENLKSELILQVHDELIVDALKEEQKEVTKILKEEMENAVKLSVPLTVEIGVGDNWYDAK